MTNSSGCEAPRKKEKLLKACNSAYIHLLQARAPLKQTPHVNTSVWTGAPEKPTALRHGVDSRRNNLVQRLCRPTNRFRYVQGLVPEPHCFDATAALPPWTTAAMQAATAVHRAA